MAEDINVEGGSIVTGHAHHREHCQYVDHHAVRERKKRRHHINSSLGTLFGTNLLWLLSADHAQKNAVCFFSSFNTDAVVCGQ